jgi:hypothetical protein
MTRADFLTYVLEFVTPRGRPWCPTAATQNAALNTYLYAFTERTWCLYSDVETIDLAANQGVYSMFTDFSSPMLTVDVIVVNDIPLATTYLEHLQRMPTYTTDTADQPEKFALIPGATKGQDSVRIWKIPTGNILACPVAGQIGHPQLLTTTADDATDISIPIDYQDVCAIFCAVKFLFPGSAAGTDIQLMAQIDVAAAKAMEDLEYRARVELLAPAVRGGRKSGCRTTFLSF